MADMECESEQSSEDPDNRESNATYTRRTPRPEPPNGPALRSMEPEVLRADEHLGKLCQLLNGAIQGRREEAIRSYRRGVQSALQRMEETAERLVRTNRWDSSLVEQLMLSLIHI